ncbi:MAG: hypothetical protein Q7O66_16650 [Dehalococcoidia bacterium]|nr:hypothetical protein [Dehalococcoidia bacterium]
MAGPNELRYKLKPESAATLTRLYCMAQGAQAIAQAAARAAQEDAQRCSDGLRATMAAMGIPYEGDVKFDMDNGELVVLTKPETPTTEE